MSYQFADIQKLVDKSETWLAKKPYWLQHCGTSFVDNFNGDLAKRVMEAKINLTTAAAKRK